QCVRPFFSEAQRAGSQSTGNLYRPDGAQLIDRASVTQRLRTGLLTSAPFGATRLPSRAPVAPAIFGGSAPLLDSPDRAPEVAAVPFPQGLGLALPGEGHGSGSPSAK